MCLEVFMAFDLEPGPLTDKTLKHIQFTKAKVVGLVDVTIEDKAFVRAKGVILYTA